LEWEGAWRLGVLAGWAARIKRGSNAKHDAFRAEQMPHKVSEAIWNGAEHPESGVIIISSFISRGERGVISERDGAA
jgi:hypothetical protein